MTAVSATPTAFPPQRHRGHRGAGQPAPSDEVSRTRQASLEDWRLTRAPDIVRRSAIPLRNAGKRQELRKVCPSRAPILPSCLPQFLRSLDEDSRIARRCRVDEVADNHGRYSRRFHSCSSCPAWFVIQAPWRLSARSLCPLCLCGEIQPSLHLPPPRLGSVTIGDRRRQPLPMERAPWPHPS